MAKSLKNPHFNAIPTSLTLEQFNEFVLPHLTQGTRGPAPKLSLHKTFSYILCVLYTGVQWHMLPIAQNNEGQPEIHYTRIFRKYVQWVCDGSLAQLFEHSVFKLDQHGLLDLCVLHGDGSTHGVKKGGDNIGYSGHKHFKAEKIVAIVDRNLNVISPMTLAPGNKHESPLFPAAFNYLKKIVQQGQS